MKKGFFVEGDSSMRPVVKNSFMGFSLVEILVSILILTFIAAGVFEIFILGDRTYFMDMGLLDLQQQARQAMDGMTREIRQTDNSDIIISNSTIEFIIPNNITSGSTTYYDPIDYYRNGNNIMREHPVGTLKILASDINSLSFCCENSDGTVCDNNCNNRHILKIQLSAQKTAKGKVVSFPVNGTITEKVRLRN